MTTKIQQEYFISGIISSQIRRRRRQKNCTWFIFYSNVLSIFLRICGYDSGFEIQNPQNAVCLNWLSVQLKIATACSMARVWTLDPWKWVLKHYTLCQQHCSRVDFMSASQSLVTAVLITPNGAESPGSGRIGAMSALGYFFPSEAV